MNKLVIKEPFSLGLILSYKCTSSCKHCIYASSAAWPADWISKADLEKILAQIAPTIQASPYGPKAIGVNTGVHITGGEPFLNFDLLLDVTKLLREFKIPSTFVETNCFWAKDDKSTREKLIELKEAGLDGILISVNPFILESVAFEKTKRVATIGRDIFGHNSIIYQELFFELFTSLGLKGTMSLDKFLAIASSSMGYIELLPMGQATYKLEDLFRKYPIERFFGISCTGELTRQWHNHIDNYCNYIPGFCSGISLGDAKELKALLKGINLETRPILKALATDIKKLYEIGTGKFGYKENPDGYISKCHLCVDIRRHIANQTEEFKELSPKEFYNRLG